MPLSEVGARERLQNEHLYMDCVVRAKQIAMDSQTHQEWRAISVITPLVCSYQLVMHLSFRQRFYLRHLRPKMIFFSPSSLSDMIKMHLFVLEKQCYCYLYSSSCVHRSNEISAKLQFAEIEKYDTQENKSRKKHGDGLGFNS